MTDRSLRETRSSADDRVQEAESSPKDLEDLKDLDAKINALLPEQYQHCYDTVKPSSMGSAGLKFDSDGKVAWNEIWTSFCDLALAGGPPHRGSLLEPISAEAILNEPEKYQKVVEEIGRGFWLTTRLPVLPRAVPGWVLVRCRSSAMASWLVRAIIAENVFARHDREMLSLPAGPHFRLGEEIKNVITALAKTCHYWTDHMSDDRQEIDAARLNGTTGESALLEPATAEEALAEAELYKVVAEKIGCGIQELTGCETVASRVLGWVGVPCPDVSSAVWLMRALIAEKVAARREADVLYIPASPNFADKNRIPKLLEIFARVRRLHAVQLGSKRRDDGAVKV
ncbi:MAG: hypothetical protein NVSMB14_06400 [Isosphaeraceae bacterium]